MDGDRGSGGPHLSTRISGNSSNVMPCHAIPMSQLLCMLCYVQADLLVMLSRLFCIDDGQLRQTALQRTSTSPAQLCPSS